MKKVPDTWYVRFPDGRMLRASNTQVLRQHLGAGQIPFASRVRRSGDEEWSALDWTQEFADLVVTAKTTTSAVPKRTSLADGTLAVEPANLATRLDPLRLKTVGLRGLLEELVAALDNTLSRPKLLVAGVAGVVSGVLVAFAASAGGFVVHSDPVWLWAGVAVLLAAVGSVANVLLTQMTYIELCQVRPVRWAEARAGLVRHSARLFSAYLVAAGGTALAIWLLRQFPDTVFGVLEGRGLTDAAHFARPTLTLLAMLVEMVLWPVLGFTLLLGPVVVIEEDSALGAMRQWWGVVRRHWGRLILYQFTAALVGLATLVFMVPLALVSWGRFGPWQNLDNVVGFGLAILAGLAAAPILAYSAVAHVFLYLNLRYEVDQNGRGE